MEIALALMTFSFVFGSLTGQIFREKPKKKKDKKEEDIEITISGVSFKGKIKQDS